MAGVPAAANPDAIIGIWATDKAEAHVEIWHDENGYNGRLTWLKEPFYAENDPEGMAGQPKVDRENPDPALRERRIVGLRIMEGFRYAGRGRWRDGTIYDPENGQTYRCMMWLTRDGTLKVRGYIGISLLGRTTEWTPVLTRTASGE
jgi:uncharacterized protein (DUF2147 family)